MSRVILGDTVRGFSVNNVPVRSLSGMPKRPGMTTAVALGSISK